jgi:fatty-acyl-CoA synthase
VQAHAGHELTDADVVTFSRGRLADYKVPRFVELVDSWPLTATGKIERFRLSEMARELAALRTPLRARS